MTKFGNRICYHIADTKRKKKGTTTTKEHIRYEYSYKFGPGQTG